MQLLRQLVASFDQIFTPDLIDIQNCRKSVKEEALLAKMQADQQHQQLEARERQKTEHSRASMSRFFSHTENSLRKLEDQQVQSSRQTSGKSAEPVKPWMSTSPILAFTPSPYLCASSESEATTTGFLIYTRLHDAIQTEQ